MNRKLQKTKDFYQKHKCKFLMIVPFLLGNGSGGVITFTELTDNVVRVVQAVKNTPSKEPNDFLNIKYKDKTLTGIKPTRAK